YSRRGGAARDLGQKRRQPPREGRRGEHAAHEDSFRETGGEENLAPGLVSEGGGTVIEGETPRGNLQRVAHVRIATHRGPVPRERKCEGGLVVLADSDRVVELGQVAFETRRDLALEWRERRGPAPCIGIL